MIKLVSSLLVCVGVAALAADRASLAQTRDAAAPATSTASSASVAGRVIDVSSQQQPVRRAIVTIGGGALAAGLSAITDDDGRFAFERVPAGEYTLTATRPGYLPAAYGATRPGRPGTPVAIRDGATLDLVVPMTHGSALEGVLRDIAGDPAPGMRVEAIRIRTRSTGDSGERAGVAFTDDRGGFRIFGLPAGEYVLAATPAVIVGGMGEIGAPTEAEVDARLATLRRGSAAPGAPGAPRPPQTPGTTPPAAPPAARGYSMPAIYFPGVVQPGDARRITLGANDERSGLDFTVQLSHAASIDGVLVPAAGKPLPQVQVLIVGGGLELPVAGGAASSGPSVTVRSADRTFRISNVPPGRYRLLARTFNAPGSGPTATVSAGGARPADDAGAGVQVASVDVEIANQDVSGVTLALQPAPRVDGRVTFDAATLRPPADASSVRVSLEPVAGADRMTNGLSAPITGTTRADGTFEFPAVVPGTYRVSAVAAGGWWPRSALIDGQDVLDGVLVVGDAGVSGLAVTMSDRHTAIAGTLTATGGRPAPEYYMVVFPSDRALWRAGSRRVQSTRPATDGAFELRLPSGSYYLAALTDIEPGDLEDATFLESLVSSALTVTVAEGERKVQNLRVGGDGPVFHRSGPSGARPPPGAGAAAQEAWHLED